MRRLLAFAFIFCSLSFVSRAYIDLNAQYLKSDQVETVAPDLNVEECLKMVDTCNGTNGTRISLSVSCFLYLQQTHTLPSQQTVLVDCFFIDTKEESYHKPWWYKLLSNSSIFLCIQFLTIFVQYKNLKVFEQANRRLREADRIVDDLHMTIEEYQGIITEYERTITEYNITITELNATIKALKKNTEA